MEGSGWQYAFYTYSMFVFVWGWFWHKYGVGIDPMQEPLCSREEAEYLVDALDKGNFPLATQCINQLKANGAKLNVDQFMVVSEAGVNVQTAIIEAAENGDRKAQMMLNMQGAARRN